MSATLRRSRAILAASALAVFAFGGCDRRESAVGGKSHPAATTQPITTVSAAAPDEFASAENASSRVPAEKDRNAQIEAAVFLEINQGGVARLIQFPPAKLRITRTAGGMTGVLYSDDNPRAGTRADYRGNSYLFNAPLTMSERSAVMASPWHYEGDSSEPEEETADGIFLSGFEKHLQPVDAMIVFEGEGPKLRAVIRGQFRVAMADERGDHIPQMAIVRGELPVTVETGE